MKRIINPWSGMEGYRCYGCDPHSDNGLRMEFFEDGDEIISRWKPRPEFQGWINTLHGGIQATLADEISSWVVSGNTRPAELLPEWRCVTTSP